MFAYLKAITVPTAVFAASEDWGSSGSVGAGLSARIEVAAEELANLVAGLPAQGRERADEFADPVPFEELLAR
jgi:FMN reductase